MESTDVAPGAASPLCAIREAIRSGQLEKVHALLDAEDLILDVRDLSSFFFFTNDLHTQSVREIAKKMVKMVKQRSIWEKSEIWECVVDTNDVELFKACFTDEEIMHLNSDRYTGHCQMRTSPTGHCQMRTSLIRTALESGAGRMLLHLLSVCALKKPLRNPYWRINNGQIWMQYFRKNGGQCPMATFSIETHKEVISKLMEFGVTISHSNNYALEHLFRSRMHECDKIELSDFLLSKGASLNDCNPQRSNYTLLHIASSRNEMLCVEYLLARAGGVSGYSVNFLSDVYCTSLCAKIVCEWLKRGRYLESNKKDDRVVETLLLLLRHPMRLDPMSVESIGTSLPVGSQPELMDHLLRYQKSDMVRFVAWDWPRTGSPMYAFLWNHFADEFVQTIMLGTVRRLNRHSPLRECSEDVFMILFEIWWKALTGKVPVNS